MKHFATLARPLTDLLKKGSIFIWTPTHQAALDVLKFALVLALVLALPDFSKPFQLQTDASDSGVGAVLLRDGHPLAFVSKSFGPRTRALSTYEKEFLAILVAVEQWRSYLQHSEFTIFTDQCSLMHITDQRLQTQWQLKMHTRTRSFTSPAREIRQPMYCLVTPIRHPNSKLYQFLLRLG